MQCVVVQLIVTKVELLKLKTMEMIENKIKYFAIAVAFMFFGSATFALAQGEVQYDKMFNKIEETEAHDVLSLLRMEENLSTFVQLIEQSGLDASIESAGPVTILAPTNEAFQEMSREDYQKLTDPENRVMLNKVIQAHILPRKVYMTDFQENQIIETSEGEEIPVETAGAVSPATEPTTVVIGGASIVKSDVEATNGLIHIMDNIIIPDETRDATIGN